MDQQTAIVIITIAAFVGLVATALIAMRRGRESAPEESRFAASTEGMTTCNECGRANFPSEANCLYCRAPLPRPHHVG